MCAITSGGSGCSPVMTALLQPLVDRSTPVATKASPHLLEVGAGVPYLPYPHPLTTCARLRWAGKTGRECPGHVASDYRPIRANARNHRGFCHFTCRHACCLCPSQQIGLTPARVNRKNPRRGRARSGTRIPAKRLPIPNIRHATGTSTALPCPPTIGRRWRSRRAPPRDQRSTAP